MQKRDKNGELLYLNQENKWTKNSFILFLDKKQIQEIYKTKKIKSYSWFTLVITSKKFKKLYSLKWERNYQGILKSQVN